MWSYATQHVQSTALHKLLLRQPGRLLQQVAWGGVAPTDATREPGAFCWSSYPRSTSIGRRAAICGRDYE